MLDKKEKYVMRYIYDECKGKPTHLVSSKQLIDFVSTKYVISFHELEEIMLSLNKDGYIDYVTSDSKHGITFCVSLKNKGAVFLKDLEKEKRKLILAIVRSVGLATLSFLVGLLLRIIFK